MRHGGAENGCNSGPSGPHLVLAVPLYVPANHLRVPGPAVSTCLKESERRMRGGGRNALAVPRGALMKEEREGMHSGLLPGAP